MNLPRYGLVTEIVDDGMSVALMIVEIGYVLDAFGESIAVQTSAKSLSSVPFSQLVTPLGTLSDEVASTV
jgi:hypothetical protein